MLLSRFLLPAALLALSALPAAAASFDCAKAATPFEHAICDDPDLSAADDRLAKSFATAMGGLTKAATALMRNDQRLWLDFAQRACTPEAQPLAKGRYDEDGARCLVTTFQARSRVLEQSRMIDGHRFHILSMYGALPDPAEADNPESYWRVATHELVVPQLDLDDGHAEAFNAFVMEQAASSSEILSIASTGDLADLDPSADTDVKITVKQVVGDRRIAMQVDTYWYGHGAAHGNWSINYLHYLTQENRALLAGDIFAGEDWAGTLVEAAWTQLQAEHGAWLQVDTADDIAASVVQPGNWDLSNDRGLVIQFQPYEVSAYAYGAPTITIPWDRLDAIKAETQDAIRHGF